jgi:recombination protein RecA
MAKVKEEKKGVDAILEQLEKKYGLQRSKLGDHKVVSTGSIQLNQAMGINGTAVGKIVEIFGPESSGKSTITLHQISEYQKAIPERKVALFDYEHSFDKKYATSLGVDVANLLIYQPDTQESGYDMIIELIKNKIVSCVVIDSQTAASPKAIIDGEMGDATIGLQARNNSKFCLKVKGLLDIHNVTLFFISQTRDSIGGMGEPTITTGGKAIKFYADVRWKVWKMNDKPNELNKTTIDVIKNKLGNPFGQAKIDILWGVGFDRLGEIIDYACEFNLIKKGGPWYTISEDIKLQGANAVKTFLQDNPEFLKELTDKVMNKINNVEPSSEEEIIEQIKIDFDVTSEI